MLLIKNQKGIPSEPLSIWTLKYVDSWEIEAERKFSEQIIGAKTML